MKGETIFGFGFRKIFFRIFFEYSCKEHLRDLVIIISKMGFLEVPKTMTRLKDRLFFYNIQGWHCVNQKIKEAVKINYERDLVWRGFFGFFCGWLVFGRFFANNVSEWPEKLKVLRAWSLKRCDLIENFKKIWELSWKLWCLNFPRFFNAFATFR